MVSSSEPSVAAEPLLMAPVCALADRPSDIMSASRLDLVAEESAEEKGVEREAAPGVEAVVRRVAALTPSSVQVCTQQRERQHSGAQQPGVAMPDQTPPRRLLHASARGMRAAPHPHAPPHGLLTLWQKAGGVGGVLEVHAPGLGLNPTSGLQLHQQTLQHPALAAEWLCERRRSVAPSSQQQQVAVGAGVRARNRRHSPHRRPATRGNVSRSHSNGG